MFKFLKQQEKIILISLLALTLRLALSFFGTLGLDQGTFIAWSYRLVQLGFSRFYGAWSDYFPGYMYVLWVLGKIGSIIPALDVTIYKLPAIFADVATGVLIFDIVKNIKGEKWAIFVSSIYVFNPAVLANSTLWGQVDSLTSFFAILSLYLIQRNYFFSAAALAIGTLIKPQAAFVAPVLLFLMIRERWKPAKIASYILIAFILFVLGFVPFANGTYLPSFILQRINLSFNQYPYTSINAFNFWGIFGFWKTDVGVPPFQLIGYILVGFTSLGAIIKFWKKQNFEYLISTFIFLSTFLFLTRMHERHLLPALAPLAITISLIPELIIPYVTLSITYLANLAYSYVWITSNFKNIFSLGIIIFLILVNIFSFIFIFYKVIKEKKFEDSKVANFLKDLINGKIFKQKLIIQKFPSAKLNEKTLNVLLLGIVIFAFISRVAFLGSPQNEYFDEVYHAFTARQMLHGNKAAWEWWNPNPPGFAYEWTHPPLAKLAMWGSMLIFGESAFGWRIPAAIFGTLSVFLTYLIAKETFKDKLVGILAAAILSLDGLVLVMSRIGMNDIYMLFFVLLSIFLFMKQKNFLSALSLGLAISSKWSAVWAIPIMGIIWLTQKKKLRFNLLWFILIPPLIYLATYIPMFLNGHDLSIFWGMQKQMWWYHTHLKATHAYSSLWWSWPFDIRPVYLYTSEEVGGMVARIYNLGNPIVFWFGLASELAILFWAIVEKNKKLGLIIFSYLIFFVPWAVSPRIMFFYHYLPSLPFLAIGSAYVLRKNLKVVIPYLIVALVFFLYFYPHWTGIKIPLWLDSSYYWFPSWR